MSRLCDVVLPVDSTFTIWDKKYVVKLGDCQKCAFFGDTNACLNAPDCLEAFMFAEVKENDGI